MFIKKPEIFLIILLFFLSLSGCFKQKNTALPSSEKITAGLDFMARDKYDDALKVFSEVLDKNPKDTSALFYRGIIYYKTIKKINGIEDFEKIIDLDPGFRWEERYLWDVVDHSFNARKDYIKSPVLYRYFIEKFPDSKNIPYAQMMIANCSLRLKEFDSAVAGYKKIIELYKEGKSQSGKNLSNQAEQIISFIKEHSDYDRKPLYMYSDIQNEVDPVKKIEIAEKLVKLYPKCKLAPNVQFQIARLYSVDGLNDFDRAMVEYKKVVDKYPDSPFAKQASYNMNLIKEKYDPETDKLIESFH